MADDLAKLLATITILGNAALPGPANDNRVAASGVAGGGKGGFNPLGFLTGFLGLLLGGRVLRAAFTKVFPKAATKVAASTAIKAAATATGEKVALSWGARLAKLGKFGLIAGAVIGGAEVAGSLLHPKGGWSTGPQITPSPDVPVPAAPPDHAVPGRSGIAPYAAPFQQTAPQTSPSRTEIRPQGSPPTPLTPFAGGMGGSGPGSAPTGSRTPNTDRNYATVDNNSNSPDANADPVTDPIGFLKSRAKSGVDISDLNPVFAGNVAQAIADAEKATGDHVKINSGFRTFDEQARLYARYKAGIGGIAAEPGHSNHEGGKALDLDGGAARSWIFQHQDKYGLRPAINDDVGVSKRSGYAPTDPPHIELAPGASAYKPMKDGGVVEKPTLALLGDGGEPEYVVPHRKVMDFAHNQLALARSKQKKHTHVVLMPIYR
jgi:hypothetical protein